VFTLKYNRTTTHIDGLAVRTKTVDTDPNKTGVVAYYAENPCPVLTRSRNLATGSQHETALKALNAALQSPRKLCQNCKKAAEAMISQESQTNAPEAAKIAPATDTTEVTEMAKTATVKNDVNTDQGKAVLEQIDANIERAASLAEAENVEGLKELKEETETLISSLSGTGSVAIRKEKRNAFAAAAQGAEKPKSKAVEKKPAEGEVTKEVQDPYSIDGVRELVDLGAEKFAEGVRLHIRMKDIAVDVAKVILDQRLRIPNKDGLPDLKATSHAAKQVSRDMYTKAGELFKAGGNADETEVKNAINKLIKGVQNHMRSVINDYLLTLDENPEEAQRWELVAKSDQSKDQPLSEAVAATYGWELPKELESGEGKPEGEGEGDGEGSGDSHATDPADTVIGYFTKAKGELSKAQKKVKALSEETDKDKIRAEIDKLVTDLVSLKASL